LTDLLGTVPLLHPNGVLGLGQELLHVLQLLLVREEALEAGGVGVAVQRLCPREDVLRLVQQVLDPTHD
jgi:hypothetical protein